MEDYVSNKKNDVLNKNCLLYKKLKKLFTPSIKNLEKILGYSTGWL